LTKKEEGVVRVEKKAMLGASLILNLLSGKYKGGKRNFQGHYFEIYRFRRNDESGGAPQI